MEEKQNLIGTTVRLRPDQIATAKQLSLNLSEWFRSEFDNRFMDVDEINKDIEKLEDQLNKRKKWKSVVIKKQEDSKNILNEELDWLVEAKKSLELNPHFIDGKIKLYLNLFKKPYNLSQAEFYELLEKAEEKNYELQAMKNIEVSIDQSQNIKKEMLLKEVKV